MSQAFPNPHEHRTPRPGPLVHGRGGNDAGYTPFNRHQGLPAVPRTVSSPQPWIQQPVPHCNVPALNRSHSRPESMNGSASMHQAHFPGRPPFQSNYPASHERPLLSPPQYDNVQVGLPMPMPMPQLAQPTHQSQVNGRPLQHQRPHSFAEHAAPTNVPHGNPNQYGPMTSTQPQRSMQPGRQPTQLSHRQPPSPPIASMQSTQQQPRRQDSLELEQAMQASEASARAEEERRRRREQEEEERIIAMSQREEEERQARQREEEDRQFQRALEYSQKDEEEERRRRERQQEEEERHAQILLEESRQLALRDDEERIKREHADIIERSKYEAEKEEKQRQQALEAEKRMEEAAVQESLLEMEREWKRREEADRAAKAYLAQGGNLGAASYWQHLNQDAAYEYAMGLERSASRMSAASVSTTSSSRRPLPPTPDAAPRRDLASPSLSVNDHTLSAVEHRMVETEAVPDIELGQGGRIPFQDEDADASEERHEEQDRNEDPFSDDAEAPPLYNEVGVDRPPEAPASIPEHIRFAPPIVHDPTAEADGSALVRVANHTREAKTPAALHSPRQSQPHRPVSAQHRDLPPLPEEPSAGPSRLAQTSGLTPAPINSDEVDDQALSRALHRVQTGQSTDVRPKQPQEPDGVSTNAWQDEGAHTLQPPVEASPGHLLAPVWENGEDDKVQVDLNEAPQQRAMKSTYFGYASEPFAPELEALGSFKSGHFPNLIKLTADKGDGSLNQPSAYFVVRAPSWKALLRSLAWYGNTHIEAGPEEVADNEDGLCLRIETEFITPAKPTLSSSRRAFASVCFSLLLPSSQDATAAEAQAEALRNASRALDTSCVRQGATRRVIALPRRAPRLPVDLARLVSLLHEAHTFSVTCPSPSSGTLHSPKDLADAVEKHDLKYVAKVQKLRRDELAQFAKRKNFNEEFASAGGSARKSVEIGHGDRADGDEEEFDELDAGAIDVTEEAAGEPLISLSRWREKLRKQLARRSSTGRAQRRDEDKSSWITPFDVSQHG